MVQNAETDVKDLKAERDVLAKGIETLKKQTDHASRDFHVFMQNLDVERQKLKAMVDKDVQTYKEQALAEVKNLREKAQGDFTQKRHEQEEELSRMRKTELETIKGLRAQEEAKFKAARKSHVLEISKALETFLVARIKEALKWTELPKNMANFFPELKGIVERVIEAEFPGNLSATDIHAAGKSAAKSKRKNYIIIGSAGLAALAVIMFVPFEDGTRKPASEVFIDRLKEKEAQKPKFNPKLTDDYKTTYTDNVLYTKDYVTFKLNSDNQSKYIQDLNKFFINQLGLDENAIVKFVSIETNLVSQLRDLRAVVHVENQKQDIKKMTDLEDSTVNDMVGVLGNKDNYRKFREFERDYFARRLPASAPAVPAVPLTTSK
jgi:hypothetical protein